jgi:hypothetical protein
VYKTVAANQQEETVEGVAIVVEGVVTAVAEEEINAVARIYKKNAVPLPSFLKKANRHPIFI